MSATAPQFGVEPDSLHGLLTTYDEFDSKSQKFDAQRKKYIGRYPTITGRICSYYDDVVSAIRGEAPLQVLPEQSRDGIRCMELARESHKLGATVLWE